MKRLLLCFCFLFFSCSHGSATTDVDLRYLEKWDCKDGTSQWHVNIPDGFRHIKHISAKNSIGNEYVCFDKQRPTMPKHIIKIYNLNSCIPPHSCANNFIDNLHSCFDCVYNFDIFDGELNGIPYTTNEIQAKSTLEIGKNITPIYEQIVERFVQTKNGVLCIAYITLLDNPPPCPGIKELKQQAYEFLNSCTIVKKQPSSLTDRR